MKRKCFSVLLALVLVLSFSLVMAVPVNAQASIIDVSPAVRVTDTGDASGNGYYERDPQLLIASSGTWYLIYSRSQTEFTAGGNPDSLLYDIYYQTSTDNGATWSVATKVLDAATISVDANFRSATICEADGKIWVIGANVENLEGDIYANTYSGSWSGQSMIFDGTYATGAYHLDCIAEGDNIRLFYGIQNEANGVGFIKYDGATDTWDGSVTQIGATAGYQIPRVIKEDGTYHLVSTDCEHILFTSTTNPDTTPWTAASEIADAPGAIWDYGAADPCILKYGDSGGTNDLIVFWAPWYDDSSQPLEYVYSTDGGASWSLSIPFTDTAHDPQFSWDMMPRAYMKDADTIMVFYGMEQRGENRRQGDIVLCEWDISATIGNAHYTTIQDGIDNAGTGDTILVYPGEYVIDEAATGDACIIIDVEGLTVEALNPAAALVDPLEPSVASIIVADDEVDDVINIAADGVTFNGFTVIGAYYGVNIYDWWEVEVYSGCIITNNYITGSMYDGIWVEGEGHTISNNIITDNEETGIYIEYSEVISISGNTFQNNGVQLFDDTGVLNIEDVLDNNTFDRAVTVDSEGALLLTIWSSIQDAIGAAVDDDTVNVAAGTYEEAIIIDKELTLLGATSGVDKNSFTLPLTLGDYDDTVQSVIKAPVADEPNTVTITASNVVLKGFVIEALNRVSDSGNNKNNLIYLYPGSNEEIMTGIVIKNNVIGPNTDAATQSFGRHGIRLNAGYGNTISAAITCNKIHGTYGNGNNVFIWGTAFGTTGVPPAGPGPADLSGTVIQDNDICNSARSGVELSGAQFGATIDNNRIHDNGAGHEEDDTDLKYGEGIVFVRDYIDVHFEEGMTLGEDAGYVDGVTISNNEIYNNDKNGIYMGPMNKNHTITGNDIHDNGNSARDSESTFGPGDGIRVDLTGDYYLTWDWGALYNCTSNIAANNNNIYDNVGYGAQVKGAPTNDFELDATNNWWGDATGPKQATTNPCASGDGVTSDVDYTPWLDAAYPDGSQRSYNVENTDTLETFNAIQAAIDDTDTDAGDTINVLTGTYNEQVAIDKQLTLEGANAGVNAVTGDRGSASIIDGGDSTAVTISANNVIVDGFTLDGGITLDDAVNLISGGTISNNVITGADNDEEPTKAQNGIRLGWDTGLGVDGVKIENNTISNSLAKGIRFANPKLGGGTASNITISGNEIKDNGSAGIETYGPGLNRIISNIISGNDGNGMNLKFDDGDVVTGNIITNNTGPGITLRQVTNTTVEDNSVSGHQSKVEIGTCPDVIGGKGSGIHIFDTSENNTIRSNDISGNNYGIFIHSKDDLQPSGNSINSNNISGNINYGLLNALVDPLTSVDATNNYWGDASGPYHATNLSGAGNEVSDNVDFEPWLPQWYPTEPSVVTATASSVFIYSAILNGSLDDLGSALSVGVSFEWGTTTAYGNKTATQTMTSTGSFSFSLSGFLQPDTTYYFKAKAVGDGTGYGAESAFTTTPTPVGGGGLVLPTVPAPPPGTTDISGEVSPAGVFTSHVTAISEDELCTLTVPEGTVGLTEELEPIDEITMLIMDEPPAPPAEANVIGLVYDFGPSGATFDPPIMLTFTYDPAEIPEGIAEGDLVLAYYDEDAGEWVELEGCVVDPVTNTVSAPVSHFTTFAIIAAPAPPPPPPAPAAFSVSDLTVQPLEVQPKEVVTITATVANSGGTEGSYSVVLMINGVKEAEQSVTVAAGGSQDVSFSIAKEDAASYSIVVDGLSGSFAVVAPTLPEEEEEEVVPEEVPAKPEINWPLIGGIIAGVIVVGLAIFFVRRRQLTRQ